MKTFHLPVNNELFITRHLQVLNGILNLTKMQRQVLGRFLVYGDVSPESRQKVMEDLGLKSSADVNNYVKQLKDKQILQEVPGEPGRYQLDERILPDKEGIEIKFLWLVPSTSTSLT